jgi:filamentous hemagglutinin
LGFIWLVKLIEDYRLKWGPIRTRLCSAFLRFAQGFFARGMLAASGHAAQTHATPYIRMNKKLYRLVFNKTRRMLVAVAEYAHSQSTGESQDGAATTLRVAPSPAFALRALAFAAMLFAGSTSLTFAQIVAAPGAGTRVLQTQNGIVQVDIARASGAGVSMNQFKQFDVTKQGAILNNSPVVTSTQLAGYVNGNSNLSPGNSAKVIVNQVLSNAPSQLSGPIEIAGQKAELVIANGNGLIVNGASFLNASRAILTTGTPNYGANGALTGFNVTSGNITVQGAGLDARGVDAVDLLARAIQVNAAIYANNLSAITGANQIDHDTLAATAIAGDGPAPVLAIDVSALGGMFSNCIFLASNEHGVGVSSKGILAAQAGDLTLQSNGRLVLAGTTNASGNINATARDGIDNGGTTYAQGSVTFFACSTSRSVQQGAAAKQAKQNH